MDNAEAIAEYARDPATGVLGYVGCYSWPGRTGYGGACTNTAAGLFYSQDMAMSPTGAELYAVSWGNNPWAPGGSLANNGGGVVDEFARGADVAVSTPPPAIVTSSTTVPGLTFGRRAGSGQRGQSHRGAATITVKLRCPDGVTRYCVGMLRQSGRRSTAVAGRTDRRGNFTFRLKLHLSNAQVARLRRFGSVKITIVFVQQMPNGGQRTTRRMITIK
jgi:hypothetical protein